MSCKSNPYGFFEKYPLYFSNFSIDVVINFVLIKSVSGIIYIFCFIIVRFLSWRQKVNPTEDVAIFPVECFRSVVLVSPRINVYNGQNAFSKAVE